MKTIKQLIKENQLKNKIADKKKSVNENATPRNIISMEDLYRSFDVDGDGVVSEADYAAHIAWHMENSNKLAKATGDLEGIHLEHISNPNAFCASEQTDNYEKEASEKELIAEDTKDYSKGSVLPPAMIVLRRLSIRQFSNGQKVALYYAKTINRYLTVPYNENGIVDLTKPDNSMSR